MATIQQLYAQFMNQCRTGFRNEHHWQAWLRKHGKEIESLPPPLRKAVLLAFENSGPVEPRADHDTEPPDQQERQ